MNKDYDVTLLNDKRHKLLSDLDTEIHKLELLLNDSDRQEKILKVRKNLRKALEALRFIYPYIIVSAINFAAFTKLNATPIIRNEVKVHLCTRRIIDSNEFENIEYSYDEFFDESKRIYIKSDWLLNEEGWYERKNIVYKADDLTDDDIEKLVYSNDTILIEDTLGDPYEISYEVANNVEYKDNGSYIMAILNEIKRDKYIYDKESNLSNIATSLVWFMISVFGSVIVSSIREGKFGYYYNEEIAKIEEAYQIPDLDDIEKKLEIKRNTFNVLVRK